MTIIKNKTEYIAPLMEMDTLCDEQDILSASLQEMDPADDYYGVWE